MLLKNLLLPETLTFTINLIKQKQNLSLKEKKIINETKVMGKLFLAITICPWFKTSEVKLHFPEGYLNLLNNLTKPAYSKTEYKHIIHWIYCSNGMNSIVHLSIIPAPDTIQAPPLLATDLLTNEEMRKIT